jgi:hypothetical protein
MTLADHLQRLGLSLPRARPTVLLAGTTGEIDRLYPMLDAVLRQRPAYRLALAADLLDVPALRRRYPHELVLPLPNAFGARRWLRRLETVLIVGRMANALSAGVDTIPGADVSPETLLERLPRRDIAVEPVPAGAFLIDLLGGRRIGSIADLAAKLGNPRTVVCLGNGPSSEDPRLAAYGGATLFRVNWNWRGRDWMTAPDVVFTADPDLPGARRRQPIIVFPRAATGRPILMRHTMALRPPSAGYAFLDGFAPPLADLASPVIPTNGALMIAVATALRPERIVIAGMDLYSHPEGRYPGDTAAQDGYSREHDAATDLALIRTSLRAFEGEAVILSDNLHLALAEQPEKGA